MVWTVVLKRTHNQVTTRQSPFKNFFFQVQVKSKQSGKAFGLNLSEK